MSALPEWVATLAGFDPAGWRCPIVCTGASRAPGRDRRHEEIEFLGVVFDHAETGELQWSGGFPGVTSGWVWHTRMTDEEIDRARGEGAEPYSDPFLGRGSMDVHCPHGCNPRIPRTDFDAAIRAARATEPPWVDLSLYA